VNAVMNLRVLAPCSYIQGVPFKNLTSSGGVLRYKNEIRSMSTPCNRLFQTSPRERGVKAILVARLLVTPAPQSCVCSNMLRSRAARVFILEGLFE
jgi:hypothetical protein